MIKVKIEGRIDFEDGSSSESESEGSERPDSPPMVLLEGQGEDEEIEYFGEKKEKPAREVKKKSADIDTGEIVGGGFDDINAEDSRLASILSKQVHEFENDSTLTQTAPRVSQPAAADPAPTTNTTGK